MQQAPTQCTFNIWKEKSIFSQKPNTPGRNFLYKIVFRKLVRGYLDIWLFFCSHFYFKYSIRFFHRVTDIVFRITFIHSLFGFVLLSRSIHVGIRKKRRQQPLFRIICINNFEVYISPDRPNRRAVPIDINKSTGNNNINSSSSN